MKSVDLDKYKRAWQNERSFDERKLPENEMEKYMQSSSGSIARLFKSGLILDISIKAVLLVSSVILFFLLQSQGSWKILAGLLAVLILSGIGWQWRVLQKIPDQTDQGRSALDSLRGYIGFYYSRYVSTIFVGALSGTLFFLIGSMYYLYFKYQEIPPFQIDDFIVFGIGIGLTYTLGAMVQLMQFRFHIRQLEVSLKEIEENTLTEQTVTSLRRKRSRILLLMILLMVIGLAFLFLLIF